MISIGLSSALGQYISLLPERLLLAILGTVLVAMGFLIQGKRNQKQEVERIDSKQSARKESVTRPIFFPASNSNPLFDFKVHNHTGRAWRPPMQSAGPGKNNTTPSVR